MADPWKIATWRWEQISPLIDPKLSRSERRALLKEASRRKIPWPSSREGEEPLVKPISRRTLKRWISRYKKSGLVGLLPKERSDKDRPRTDRETAVIYALGLLYEEPERSLTQLLVYLEIEFPGLGLKRSTLHRDLQAHPAYRGVLARREGKRPKLYDRYEAAAPHDSWQMDGKGPFTVDFVDGRCKRLHVLSILDDHSRVVLAGVIARSENLADTVRVFRLAAEKYGLPSRFQFDRGSAFDAHLFRTGLGQLGVHRNRVQAKSPTSQGKIEAYHRSLSRWFVQELEHQEVVDLAHLEGLLQAVLDRLYNQHHHRELGKSPADALAGRVSPRQVSRDDLRRAFREHAEARSDRKTGKVMLPNGTFRVPRDRAGKKDRFTYDLVEPEAFLLRGPAGPEVRLEPFMTKRPFFWEDHGEKEGTGQLQKLYDQWKGRKRPNAQPGFGLPEVFQKLAELVGRSVPADEREATQIHRFYAERGPLPAGPFREAIARTARKLGAERPMSAYLNHLKRLVDAAKPEASQ